jgi:hypothetical protein
MAQRNRRRMMPSPLHPISAETAQLDNADEDGAERRHSGHLLQFRQREIHVLQ